MGMTIKSVEVVGFCREHADGKDKKIPEYKDGKKVPDEDIACVQCDL